MYSSNQMPERDRLDALYFELCVLQGCALGTCFAAENRLDGLYDNMKTGLLREFDRVMEMFDHLTPGEAQQTDA